jgi:hypothetical protein
MPRGGADAALLGDRDDFLKVMQLHPRPQSWAIRIRYRC